MGTGFSARRAQASCASAGRSGEGDSAGTPAAGSGDGSATLARLMAAWPRRVRPSGVCPSRVCPSRVRPSGVCPSGVCPTGFCPSRVCPSLVCSSGVCPSGVCPSRVCPSRVCPSGVRAMPGVTGAPRAARLGLGREGMFGAAGAGPWLKDKLLYSVQLQIRSLTPRCLLGPSWKLPRPRPDISRGSRTVSLRGFPSKASAARGKGGGTGSAIPKLSRSQTEFVNLFPRWGLGRESRSTARCRAGILPDLQVQLSLERYALDSSDPFSICGLLLT